MPALQSAEVVRIPQRFSDTFVRRLQLGAGEKDRIYWDPEMPGFGVRVRSTKTVYIVQYRFQKATQRESLGDVRKLTIEDARKVEPMDDRGEELAREVRKVDADHRHQR